MSKEFALLTATQKLGSYLSREQYNLSKMETNERVTDSFLQSKVKHYNDMVNALNMLFNSLTSGTGTLFPYYEITRSIEVDESYELDSYESQENQHTDYAPVSLTEPARQPVPVRVRTYPTDSHVPEVVLDEEPVIQAPEPVTTHEELDAGGASHVEPESEPELESESESESEPELETESETQPEEIPTWELDGYASHELWLADKEAESIESAEDDVSVSVNSKLSQYRAEQALNEYHETTEQDISTYDPEDDAPVSVLPVPDETPESDNEFSRPTENLNYLNHTVDNVRVNDDPVQIALVETAVERGGEDARRGAEIDISGYMYQSDNISIDNVIDDEIRALRMNNVDEPLESEDGFNDVSHEDESDNDVHDDSDVHGSYDDTGDTGDFDDIPDIGDNYDDEGER